MNPYPEFTQPSSLLPHLPEVDSRLLLGVVLDLVAVELADLAPRVEDPDEGRIVLQRKGNIESVTTTKLEGLKLGCVNVIQLPSAARELGIKNGQKEIACNMRRRVRRGVNSCGLSVCVYVSYLLPAAWTGRLEIFMVGWGHIRHCIVPI